MARMSFAVCVFASVLAFTATPLALMDARAQSPSAPTTIRVATIPVANYTPLIVARDKGWFAEENLNVSWTAIAQGAIAVEAVFGGSVEIGGSSIFEPMVARGNGLDVMFAVAGTRTHNAPPDNSGLLVRASDAISSPADLAGKTVSAGLINSVNYIHFQDWLKKHGVNPTSVRLLEIPFPQMGDALFQNRIDAIWAVEPFLTLIMKSGKARVLAYPYTETIPGMDITAYIAKESWLKANPDVAQRFKRAIDRATNYLESASKEERDMWTAAFTKINLDIVRDMNLPVFKSEFNVESLKANLDMAVRYKMVPAFDVETMIWKR